MEKELTCIIGFRNEGKWVGITCKSIRESSTDVDIILINDASNDGYDYEGVAAEYGCTYIANSTPQGVAHTRDIGVSHCKTPYFILLDGHMKFPVWGWDRQVVGALHRRPNSIVFTNTVTMFLDKEGKVENEECKIEKFRAFGAYIDFESNGAGLESKWAYKAPTNDFMFIVPSVMGATYASSVKWWEYIRGLEGLRSYGEDESYMALKTWIMGGRCYILPYLGVGHLYRLTRPYVSPTSDHIFNKLMIIDLFIDDKERHDRLFNETKAKYGTVVFSDAMKIREENMTFINEMKEYIRKRQMRSIDYFENKINKPFLDATKKK